MSNENESGRIGISTGEFSVYNEYKDGFGGEYVRRWVGAEEAMTAFQHHIASVGARMGTTVRVIITDGLDLINAEWIHGKGVVFPAKDREVTKG